MKKILIVCGSGYATSFAMKNRLEKLLADKHCLEDCEIICTDIKSFDNCLFEPDMIIQLAHKFREKYSGIPMFNGIPFLTGVGLEELMEKIIVCLEKKEDITYEADGCDIQ